jgi:hypothetical protein
METEMTQAMAELLPSLFESAAATMTRGVVVTLSADGIVIATRGHELRECDHLAHSVTSELSEGDEVLAWLPADTDERGVIIGRVRAGRPATPKTPTPDELIIEAKQSMTLRVGDGSITIREDGRVLIKGKDLVSHAQRMNRIKGGAVSIN